MSLETCLVILFLAKKKIGTPSLGTDSAQIDSAKFTERVKMKVWTEQKMLWTLTQSMHFKLLKSKHETHETCH